jgi:hypothetical protein
MQSTKPPTPKSSTVPQPPSRAPAGASQPPPAPSARAAAQAPSVPPPSASPDAKSVSSPPAAPVPATPVDASVVRAQAMTAQGLHVWVRASARDPTLLLVRLLPEGHPAPSGSYEAYLRPVEDGADIRMPKH